MECYQIPSSPLPLLLPVECVAEIVAKPQVVPLEEARANWMRGHVTWQNQRLPVLSYAALHSAELDESGQPQAHLVVLNPVPDAARKAFAGLICHGQATTITVGTSAAYVDIPDEADRRYVEAAVEYDGKTYLVPRLAALAVAFSYF